MFEAANGYFRLAMAVFLVGCSIDPRVICYLLCLDYGSLLLLMCEDCLDFGLFSDATAAAAEGCSKCVNDCSFLLCPTNFAVNLLLFTSPSIVE